MSVRVELIADRGAAAASDDFFRSRPFLDAEGVTHTLRLESPGHSAAVPLIVRPVASGLADAVSPYGYPGGLTDGDGEAPAPADVDWSSTGLVTIFARERLERNPWLAGARHRSDVHVHDPRRPRAVRPRLAEQVRAILRRGWEVDALRGSETSKRDREAFAAVHEQTMRRASAVARHFVEREYFDAILTYGSAWLVLARSPEGEVGAGAIAALSDGLLHYYLGGTRDAALADSPFKVVVVAMLDLADELSVRLNLGGGVRLGDGLERFKRGFANASLPFRTHEVVCDRRAYERLAADRDAGEYFPAYRAP